MIPKFYTPLTVTSLHQFITMSTISVLKFLTKPPENIKCNLNLWSLRRYIYLNKLYEDLKMKKLLIATTALVTTAGMAAADVKISGYAEIGMIDGGGLVGVEMHNDMDIGFKLSGASDNGLTFGASIDLDEVSGGIASTGGSQAVNVSGAFGTLTMGDTDGALDKVNAEVGMGSAIADDHTAHAGYNGGAGLDSGDILRYDTSVGNFAVSASVGMDDSDNGGDDVVAYGVSTTVGTVALSLAYQANDGEDVTAVSAKTSLGGMSVVVNYSEASLSGTAQVSTIVASQGTGTNPDVVARAGVAAVTAASNSYEHTAIGLGYTVNGVALSANFGEYSYNDGTSADGMGVAANYGLGGGATVMVGYGSSNSVANVSSDTFSIGLGLSF